MIAQVALRQQFKRHWFERGVCLQLEFCCSLGLEGSVSDDDVLMTDRTRMLVLEGGSRFGEVCSYAWNEAASLLAAILKSFSVAGKSRFIRELQKVVEGTTDPESPFYGGKDGCSSLLLSLV